MTTSESLGVGLYSLVEAARLLQIPRRTLSRWVEGYVLELRGGEKQYLPLLERDDEAALTFGDLVELRYVKGFRDEGVKLQKIRDVSYKFRREWDTTYPLATKRFASDGRSLLLQEGAAWVDALTGQGSAFFEELGRQFVHVGDFAGEWRPLGGTRAVVLHPDRAFGKPIEDRSGAHTYVLASAVENGASPEEVAWWYDTTLQGVLDAVEYESGMDCVEGQKDVVPLA